MSLHKWYCRQTLQLSWIYPATSSAISLSSRLDAIPCGIRLEVRSASCEPVSAARLQSAMGTLGRSAPCPFWHVDLSNDSTREFRISMRRLLQELVPRAARRTMSRVAKDFNLPVEYFANDFPTRSIWTVIPIGRWSDGSKHSMTSCIFWISLNSGGSKRIAFTSPNNYLPSVRKSSSNIAIWTKPFRTGVPVSWGLRGD